MFAHGRSLLDETRTAEPSQLCAGPGSAAKAYLTILTYPFTGMMTGFASLNVSLLLAVSSVTSLLAFALALSVSLTSFLVSLFGPAIELVSNG